MTERLTIAEAAVRLGVTSVDVYRLITERRLPRPVEVGWFSTVPAASVEALRAELQGAATDPA